MNKLIKHQKRETIDFTHFLDEWGSDFLFYEPKNIVEDSEDKIIRQLTLINYFLWNISKELKKKK